MSVFSLAIVYLVFQREISLKSLAQIFDIRVYILCHFKLWMERLSNCLTNLHPGRVYLIIKGVLTLTKLHPDVTWLDLEL